MRSRGLVYSILTLGQKPSAVKTLWDGFARITKTQVALEHGFQAFTRATRRTNIRTMRFKHTWAYGRVSKASLWIARSAIWSPVLATDNDRDVRLASLRQSIRVEGGDKPPVSSVVN